MPTTKPKSEYCIQTVENALRLLEAFEHAPTFGVSELARRMELHKNNVFRLLATLEGRGYIEQCPDSDRYRLGAACLAVGRSFTRAQDLVERSRMALETVVAEVGEVAHLGVLQGYEVFHLEAESGAQMLQCTPRVGRSLPAHASALGKILIGCNDETTRRGYREAIVAGDVPLVARTGRTLTDPDKLAEHLQAVGVAGYATDLEECELGLHCAAAPVYDASGGLVGSISVSGPAFRLSEDALATRVRTVLVDVAGRLSRSLGWEG